MTYALRSYQQRTLDKLYDHWMAYASVNPLCVLPTGAGKSVVIAELTRLLFDTWPDDHPRTVVLVPSKELAEQNAEKLRALLPANISVGYYSASLGRKNATADVIVATIGSIARDAHLIGNIKCVVIDEAHLVNSDGNDTGRYRKFISDLNKYCQFRVVGFTATPFRGNGIWLTDGEDPLFGGVACTVKVQELLDSGHLAPLVRPMDVIATRIDTDGISTTSGDYNVGELSERVNSYLPQVSEEVIRLAADRKKWIAFCATVDNATALRDLLIAQGITCAVVTGDTPKQRREELIKQFRNNELRCLVTVLALATGFDVPDVDCVIWCRPTKSPVLYVQGAGRGMRIAPGKTDCLWLDFSDTTERLGPVDAIKGRSKRGSNNSGAPYAICPECGERVVPANLKFCPQCGAQMREEAPPEPKVASNHAVLSQQVKKVIVQKVTHVTYQRHKKVDGPDSLAVMYWNGVLSVAREWVCFDHTGWPREKACNWWRKRFKLGNGVPADVTQALEHSSGLATPKEIALDTTGKYPQVVGYTFE